TRGHHLQDRRRSDILLPAARNRRRVGCSTYRQWLCQGSAETTADGVCRRGTETPGAHARGERRVVPRRKSLAANRLLNHHQIATCYPSKTFVQRSEITRSSTGLTWT